MSGAARGRGRGAERGKGMEVAPLSQRVAAMMAFRVALVAVLAVLAHLSPDAAAGRRGDLVVVAVYGVVSAVLSSAVLLPRAAGANTAAVRAFGTSLLVDGVFLQYAHERLGHGVAIDVALAAQLVAVCLLASFRTGLKLAVWQSVLLVVALRSEQTGLVPPAPVFAKAGALDRERLLVVDMMLLWLVVITTSVAASINERELRRRRLDAESLERFAAHLLVESRPRHVLKTLVDFVVAELGARRMVVVRHEAVTPDGAQALDLLVGHGAADVDPARLAVQAHRSAFLAGAEADPSAGLTLRLDPRLDPFLAALLPDARRLAAVPLGGPSSTTQVWAVIEFGGEVGWLRRALGRGGIERRTVSAATQAAATAALAYSRAELMERAQRAASTDGLTGLANRRTFDETMAALLLAWQEQGIPFALVLADVDHFKSVNDRFGHQVGDEVLQAVARVFAANAVEPAIPARYGGEEFAMIMPGAGAAQAAEQAERLRRALHDIERPVRVSASFGVACVPDDADSVDAVILASDAALLQAKERGRDRVVLATSSAASGLLGVAQANAGQHVVPIPREHGGESARR